MEKLPEKVELVKLPNGEILDGCFIWPGFAKDISIDIDDLWNKLLSIPTWPSEKEIPFREKGDDPHWIEGSHPALNYRGHSLKRHKIWCQSEYEKGMRKYGYTGWQHRISYATHSYKSVNGMVEYEKAFNSKLKKVGLLGSSEKKHNHWIITKYNDGIDNIGFHSDKDKDFEPDSWIVIVKMGASRNFDLQIEGKTFWSKELLAGTGIFMNCKANQIVKHAVPPMKKEIGISGSIVSRCIKTLIPWDKVHKNVKSSNRNREKKNKSK